MNKVIGVTGRMGSGKSTFIKKLKTVDINNNFIYLNIDEFRRNIKELEFLKPYIYNNQKLLVEYKNILYKELKNYILKTNKSIIIEWALIVEDNISDLFNLLIIIDCDKREILKRLKCADLTKKEINQRLKLQMTTKEKLKKIKDKNYILIENNYNEKEIFEELMKG